jgi:hypothetical protein
MGGATEDDRGRLVQLVGREAVEPLVDEKYAFA